MIKLNATKRGGAFSAFWDIPPNLGASLKRLIICVPGLNGSTAAWNPLLEKLLAEDAFQTAKVLRFDHECRWYSTAFATTQSMNLLAMIDSEWELHRSQGQPYDQIYILAHSIGAVFVRRAFLTALQHRKGREPSPWAKRVTRIVLFAGVNRGLFSSIDESERKTPCRLRRWLARGIIQILVELPTHFLVEDLLAGSDFVVNIRLSWIRVFSKLDRPPVVVQILGTEDGLVTEDDSIDLEQFPTGHRIDLAGADHASVVAIDDKDEARNDRYPLIRRAVLEDLHTSPNPSPPIDQPGTVVFVVHGIRASNSTWVREASLLLKARMPAARVVPATYWYFSALHFFLPLLRKRRTRWFKETYSYYLSRNPGATFHFIGHSNGTYLLGHSLKNLPDMHFARVILAGSVLPTNFNWRSRLGTQVQEIWNHRAQRDVPVAILCAALRGLGMKDIGTGGYDGFESIPEIHECCYHLGGHGAALEKLSLPSLIAHLVEKESPLCEPHQEALEWFSRISRASFMLPYLTLILIAALTYFGGAPVAQLLKISLLLSCVLIGGFLVAVVGIALEIM